MKSSPSPSPIMKTTTPTPTLEADQVLIRVRGATVSKMDLVLSDNKKVLIRECSGRIIKVGTGVTRWRTGDKVCALVNAKGYAEEVVVSSGLVLPAPSRIPLLYAAQLPVVTCNTYYAVHKCLHELRKGQVLVIHEVLFHVTLFAVGRAKSRGLTVFVVTDILRLTKDRRKMYKIMGVDALIYCQNENIVERVCEMTRMEGANAVLSYGADKITEYSQCLAKNGVILLVSDGKHKIMPPQVEDACPGHLTASRIKVCNIESVMASLDKESLESLIREVEYYVWADIKRGLQVMLMYPTVPPTSDVVALGGLINKLCTEKVIMTPKKLSMASKVRLKGIELAGILLPLLLDL